MTLFEYCALVFMLTVMMANGFGVYIIVDAARRLIQAIEKIADNTECHHRARGETEAK